MSLTKIFSGVSLVSFTGAAAYPMLQEKLEGAMARAGVPSADKSTKRVIQNGLVALGAMGAMMASLHETNASKKAKLVATLAVGVATMIPSLDKVKAMVVARFPATAKILGQ